MGDTVTITAFCKLFMDNGAMRFAMAILALGDLTVLRMAFGAGKGRMLRHIIFQQLICLFMTAGAYLFGFRNRIRDVQRGVHRMTGQAVRSFKSHEGAVVFMAFGTFWNASVFLRMAG